MQLMTTFGKPLDHSYLKDLKKILAEPKNDPDLFEAIVNAPFRDKVKAVQLHLGLLQMTLVNTQTNMVDRIALSDTEPAQGAVGVSVLPFKAIHVPYDYKKNLIVKAIRTGQPQSTSDWQYLFIPALSPEEARFNQAGAGVACSFIYPLLGVGDGGALTFSFYQPLNIVSDDIKDFMRAYTNLAIKFLSTPPRKFF